MRIAVIDIGSNAIRAAVYNSQILGTSEIYNEKFKSDIIKNLDKDNFLSNNSTYLIFAFFIRIFKKLEVELIECVATEVLRNQPRADEFINHIYEKFNIKIKILTGEEEAKFTALGLISSIPDAKGIAADLGGGSFELAEIYNRTIGIVKSLPLGTKILLRNQSADETYIQNIIEQNFAPQHKDNLYLIGGAFRLIGRCYMDYNNSAIKNLHNLVITTDVFGKFLEELFSLQKFQHFSKRYRINNQAIYVIKGLINCFNPANIIISTFGLKEGVRFNLLPEEEQQKDIVLERCFNLSKNHNFNLDLNSYLELYKAVGFTNHDFYQKMLIIAILLCNSIENIDRNYRAEYMINFILSTDIPFNQHQRAVLILIIEEALTNKKNLVPKQIRPFYSKLDAQHAQVIGSLIKLCHLIDGSILIKPSFNLYLKNIFLEISTENMLPKIIFERACELLKRIGISRRSLI